MESRSYGLYGASPAIWDHAYHPIQAGRYLIYLPRRDGGLSWPWPAVKPTTTVAFERKIESLLLHHEASTHSSSSTGLQVTVNIWGLLWQCCLQAMVTLLSPKQQSQSTERGLHSMAIKRPFLSRCTKAPGKLLCRPFFSENFTLERHSAVLVQFSSGLICSLFAMLIDWLIGRWADVFIVPLTKWLIDV